MAARSALGFAVAIALALGGNGPAQASRRDWTGSAACGGCHPAELAAWLATPHARTRERFAPGRTDRAGSAPRQASGAPRGEGAAPADPGPPPSRCLGCHATGEAPAGPAIAIEVGCEACHGAGAAYAEADIMRDRPVALALGLADVSTPRARAAVCAPCHRARTRGTAFDPTAPVHPTSPRDRGPP